MQRHVKYLCSEDDRAWNLALKNEIADYFRHKGFRGDLIRPYSAYDGDEALQLIRDGGWDIATVDLNLNPPPTGPKISGRNLLRLIGEKNAAFFVIIITGAPNDEKLSRQYDKSDAEVMRHGILTEAVAHIPAHRVRLLHKPKGSVKESSTILRPHLWKILDQYCVASAERNVFRPGPKESNQWEIRFNGGDLVSIEYSETFQIIRSALKVPHEEARITQLMSIIARSSGQAGAAQVPQISQSGDKRDHQGEVVDSAWLASVGTTKNAPGEVPSLDLSPEDVIRAFLRPREDVEIERAIDELAPAIGESGVATIVKKVAYYAEQPRMAKNEFDQKNVGEKLESLLVILKRKQKQYEEKPVDLAADGGLKLRLAGKDTDQMVLGRQHWKRFVAKIGNDERLEGFLEHITASIKRGYDKRGRIAYEPKGGIDFAPYWRV